MSSSPYHVLGGNGDAHVQHHTHDLSTLRGRAELFVHRIARPYRKLSAKSKITLWIVAGLHVFALVFILVVTPRRIAQWFHNAALGLRAMGWKGTLLVIVAVMVAPFVADPLLTAVASSHPPLFGFSASMSMIGFAYGLWWGMLIGAIACILGGTIAWFSIRTFFLDWMRRFGSSKNKQWEAFGHVMREKGWPLVAMIRWCPLPWAIGNGLFASIDGVEFWHFTLANVLFLPRLLIPVFIGSRLGNMAEGDSDKPDPVKFWVNLISIIISVVVSAGTGVLIYRLTLEQMRQLETCAPGEGELAAAALEQTALLGDYSDEEDVEEELVPRGASTLLVPPV